MAANRVKHLDVEEVWDVQTSTRPSDSLADACRATIEVQEHGDRSGSIKDDQKPLAEVARVVGVSHPSYGDLGRLVGLHRLVMLHHLQPLLHSRLLSHLLYLGEQVI